ncbi:MAG: hypothetical protein OSB09_08380 [Planctomycetota bacterium]|nr:hypothetical protein [Planctomycetota bacterium]
MISTALLTISILATCCGSDLITADELALTDGSLAHLQGRVGDRIGNTIHLDGWSALVKVAPLVKIPRRGRKDRPMLLDLWLVKNDQGWSIIQAVPVGSWEQSLAHHRSRLTDGDLDQRTSILRFLLREAPDSTRQKLWVELESPDTDVRAWIHLGGQFLSGEPILGQTIERLGLQSLAIEQQLFLVEGLWLSKSDYFQRQNLVEVNGKVTDSRRDLLARSSSMKLDKILTSSRTNSVSKVIRSGSTRKSVLAIHGNPGEVTWVQLEDHLVEEWTYHDQVVRLIDGRVFEIDSIE